MISFLRVTETAICGIPVAIWGAGALEGTTRTIVEAVKLAFKNLKRSNTDLKKEFHITKGCIILTCISLIPFVCRQVPYIRYILKLPCYYATINAYKVITHQTIKYTSIKYAFERAENHLVAKETHRLANWIIHENNPQKIEDAFDVVTKQIKDGIRITQSDLDESAKKLHGTLIYRNWSYTVTYFTVQTGWKAVKSVARFTSHLFRSGIFTFCINQIKEEIRYTANIPTF